MDHACYERAPNKTNTNNTNIKHHKEQHNQHQWRPYTSTSLLKVLKVAAKFVSNHLKNKRYLKRPSWMHYTWK